MCDVGEQRRVEDFQDWYERRVAGKAAAEEAARESYSLGSSWCSSVSNHAFETCRARLNSSFAPGHDFDGLRLDRLSYAEGVDSSIGGLGAFCSKTRVLKSAPKRKNAIQLWRPVTYLHSVYGYLQKMTKK